LANDFGAERTFFDIASIEPGADFRQVIDAAVESTAVVVAVIGRRWVSPRLQDPDDFVRRELAVALARPGARVLPVLVDGARMPRSAELPEDIMSCRSARRCSCPMLGGSKTSTA
jgi:hypothetical protein